jgi:hypothetical protein
MNTPTFLMSRKHTHILVSLPARSKCDQISSWEEKKVVEFTRSSFVLGRSGTGYVHTGANPAVCLIVVIGRKTTVIVFKIFGIERAWQNRESVGPRPRQLFITKSQLLADKVEHDYVNLLFSLSAGPDTPQYIHDRIQYWKSRRKNNILDPDDAEGTRNDLPEKYSELQDHHFPLFLTVDTVCRTLVTKKQKLIPAVFLYSSGAS